MSAIEHKIKLSALIKIIKFACLNKETNHFNVPESINILIDLGLLNPSDIEIDLHDTQNTLASFAGLDKDNGQ